MSTNSSLNPLSTSLPLLLSEDQAAKLSVTFNFAIIPCLSAVGICGNVVSMFLLARQGFRRSSNVLLFSLALADVFFLAGINNFSRRVQAANVPAGYRFSENINYMFYVFYMLQLAAHYVGLNCSILFSVLITGERLLVIFLPLKGHTLVTPLRTVLATSCVCVLIIACFIYQYVLCFRLEQVLVNGVLMGRVAATKQLNQDLRSGAYRLFIEIFNYMTGIVPMVLVVLGCAVIGLKIYIIVRRRRQLTLGGVSSKANPTSRPILAKRTRTLLSICFLYILCGSLGFIFAYIDNVPYLLNEAPLRIVFDLLSTFSQCINSVGNFIIYVAANNNFRYTVLRAGCVLSRTRVAERKMLRGLK